MEALVSKKWSRKHSNHLGTEAGLQNQSESSRSHDVEEVRHNLRSRPPQVDTKGSCVLGQILLYF